MDINAKKIKILVSIMTALGDNIYATAALGAIRRSYPEAEITVITWKVHEFLFARCPYVDKLLLIDFSAKEYRKQLEFVLLLRKEVFDLAINLDNKTRSLIYLKLAKIKRIVLVGGMYGRVNLFKKHLLSDDLVMIDSKNQTVHVIDQYLDAIQAVTGVRGERRANIGEIRDEDMAYVKDLIISNKNYSQKKKLVCLCIRDENIDIRNWKKAEWINIVRRLTLERNCFCYTIGTKNEYNYAQAVIDAAKVPAANFCGKTNINQMLALLKSANMLIAPCSGTAHMASALNVPTIVIYTNSRIFTWSLQHDAFLPVSSFEECKCYRNNEDCVDRKCWNNINASDVLLAFDGLQSQLNSFEG
ncbi:MAG: glycosyltransferase family 9 protein [Negativicutes bacterium]|jgi:ADP-heptose:LPS heptosyltransferase